GAGATTTRANQVALGTSSSTYTMPGITSQASRNAQSGPTQIVTSDANGNLATDGGATFAAIESLSTESDRARRDIEENRRGIALAMAMKAPYVPTGKRFALSVGGGYFESEEAAALSAALRASESVQFEFAVGSARESTVGGRVGFTAAW
ncbi:MAG: YadA-like family protein, partial [Spongiibacter sp.]